MTCGGVSFDSVRGVLIEGHKSTDLGGPVSAAGIPHSRHPLPAPAHRAPVHPTPAYEDILHSIHVDPLDPHELCAMGLPMRGGSSNATCARSSSKCAGRSTPPSSWPCSSTSRRHMELCCMKAPQSRLLKSRRPTTRPPACACWRKLQHFSKSNRPMHEAAAVQVQSVPEPPELRCHAQSSPSSMFGGIAAKQRKIPPRVPVCRITVKRSQC